VYEQEPHSPREVTADKDGGELPLTLQQQLEQIGKLPAAKQRAIAQVLDAMLQQHGA